MIKAVSEMTLESPAFVNGAMMPKIYSSEGEDLSPPLEWSKVPEGTKSFALINHDPDAPVVADGIYGVIHWVLYNIPGSVRSLPEGTADYTSGPNIAGNMAYKGPMPPEGHGRHNYYFVLYALNEELNLEPGLTLRQLLEKIEPHIIGINRLIGCYER